MPDSGLVEGPNAAMVIKACSRCGKLDRPGCGSWPISYDEEPGIDQPRPDGRDGGFASGCDDRLALVRTDEAGCMSQRFTHGVADALAGPATVTGFLGSTGQR